MKLAKRDLKLLLILAGLVIFLLLYLLVFNPAQTRLQEIEARSSQLTAQVQELETQYLHMADYEAGIDAGRKNVRELLESFPGDVKEEDILSYLLTMEAKEGIHMESVTFNPPEIVQSFPAVLEQSGQDVAAEVEACRASTVMTGSLTYPQAKNVIDYFYASPRQTTLENATLTYNAESGQLTGTFQLAKYFIRWDGAEYIPERVPVVDIGLGDLFGTT